MCYIHVLTNCVMLNRCLLAFSVLKKIHCSSVSIVTDYGLDGPGSNPGREEIFRPSRPSLGSTQPPVQCVPGLFRGKVRPGRAADHSPTF